MYSQNYLSRGKKPYQQFQFRCIIPKDLEVRLGTREFRIALKSSLYSHSKIISLNLYHLSRFIFSEIRSGFMKEITLEDIKNILRIEVRKSLLHIHHYEYGTNVYDDEKLKESISRVDRDEENLRERLKKDYKGTIGKIENEIDKILISQNLNPNKKNVEYKGLVRKWVDLKLVRQNWKKDLLNESGKTDNDFREELEEKWKLGLFGDEVVYPLPEPSTPSPKPPLSPSIQSSGSSPLFSKVYPDYLDFMRRNKRREGTIAETEETYRDFLIILGDKPIGDYTREDGREYRNTLSRIPKNRKKVTEYRDKTLSEILSMDVPTEDVISNETQSKLSSRIIALWNFLIDEYSEFVKENVFRGKSQSKVAIRRKDKKERFTDEDLETIFNPRTYISHIFDNPYNKHKFSCYFIPLVGVFTSCRIEEICMMRVKDIKRVGNIWVYKIREDGETKVKTLSSERDVPFHPTLWNTLGFGKYYRKAKDKGYERVFNDLKLLKGRNIYHKSVGRWFNERYLKDIGLKDGIRKISFHSFRHSIETHLTNKNVNTRFIDYIQGHSQKGIGGDVYLKEINPQTLYEECVQKIDWGIDFNKLKFKC